VVSEDLLTPVTSKSRKADRSDTGAMLKPERILRSSVNVKSGTGAEYSGAFRSAIWFQAGRWLTLTTTTTSTFSSFVNNVLFLSQNTIAINKYHRNLS
jgi:hypothetical protein